MDQPRLRPSLAEQATCTTCWRRQRNPSAENKAPATVTTYPKAIGGLKRVSRTLTLPENATQLRRAQRAVPQVRQPDSNPALQ
jgi:hypothetical protein